MLKHIAKSDINLRPFKVYKTFTFTENVITASLAYNHTGSNDVLTTDEIFQNGIYHQLYTMYYRDPHNLFTSYGDIAPISESYNTTTSQRYLDTAARVLSISQKYYGEGIKPGSIRLNDLKNNKIYTDDTYSNLIDITGSFVGNVFYSHGLIVITNDIISGSNTGSKYSTFDNYELIYKSTNTIYENEILLVVNEDEFNVSTNPTSYTEMNIETGSIYVTNSNILYEIVAGPDAGGFINYYDINKQEQTIVIEPNNTYNFYANSFGDNELINCSFIVSDIAGFKWRNSDKYQKAIFADYEYSSSIDPIGSYLAPYITTIGLYDENMDMVAVAKLAKPVKSMTDLPVNFLIRFDS
jgi:hypothetical protein